MTSPGADTIVRRADVLWRRVAGGILIRRRGIDETVMLSGTGVELWGEIGSPVAVGQLARRLADTHDAEVATVAADLATVLDDLVERGVVLCG
jgi:hypothetical protein